MKMKKGILIVEDDYSYLNRLKNILENKIGGSCIVYPEKSDETKDFISSLYLVSQLIKGNFDDVLNYFQYIDIFIIDIHLRGSTDKSGIDFANAILEEARNVKIILISNEPRDYEDIISNEKVITFEKKGSDQKSTRDLAVVVAQEISKMLKSNE